MPIFKSSREKRLWVLAGLVMATIFSTLFVGQPLANLVSDQDIQAAIFVLVMILIGIAILMHALAHKSGKLELIIIIGLAAVYILLFLRLGIPERSHLLEYSILAIFIHKALIERYIKTRNNLKPALTAFLLAASVGVIDECLQLFLPNRVFDPIDILFNTLTILMAIGVHVLLNLIRRHLKRTKSK